METASAIRQRQPQPFRYAAMAYCDEHGITDAEECERVRLSMVQRELQECMAPLVRMAARRLGFFPLGSSEYCSALNTIEQELGTMQRRLARELGIDLPAP